jgi:hypothetical protein
MDWIMLKVGFETQLKVLIILYGNNHFEHADLFKETFQTSMMEIMNFKIKKVLMTLNKILLKK